MKYKTTVTVALTSFAIFLALVVAGGICIAAGFADYAKNSGVVDSIQDVVDYIDDYNINFEQPFADAEKASAEYVRELGNDVEKIVLSTGGCRVDVRSGSEFSVSFTGKAKAGLSGSADQTVTSTDAKDYYDNSGVINASFGNGVLDISVETAKTIDINIISFGANDPLGHITVTLPADYSGSFELDGSFAEVIVADVNFDELVLDSCMGEIDLHGCSANMLAITNLAGEVEAENCTIAGVRFENIAGEINLTTLCEITADSLISDVAGEINIDLPRGARLNVTRDDVLGELHVDRSIAEDAGAASLEVTDVVGEVSVEIDD